MITPGCTESNDGAPVLLLATDSDFGTYTAEILKTEGFNAFEMDSLSGKTMSASYLSKYDLIILAESGITDREAGIIRKFVKNGGNMIAIRPDPLIADLFGIVPVNGTVDEGYINIDTSSVYGKGLTSRLLQFHGKAQKYILNGGTAIADMMPDKSAGETFPAVVSNNYGKGSTLAFIYNLPESVVYTRQGNTVYAGVEKDDIPGLRGMDLFTDGWLDTTNSIINQADEQMVLLSHCIEFIDPDLIPLPRFWYFPDNKNCLVTLTNDGEYRNENDFESQFRDVDSMNARMTLYILEVEKVSKSWCDKWTKKGFEISGHPDNTQEASDPQWNNMSVALSSKKKEISEHYALTMRTVVNHWFVWCGKDAAGNREFAAQAEIEADNGIELDANYAHYDNNSGQGHFLGSMGRSQGNFTGSGLVMKFANSKGKVIDVYQHHTNVYDQQYTENDDADGFFDCFRGIMDRSLDDEVYSFVSIKAHNDEYYFSKKPLMKMLEYARSRNIPVWTAVDLLDFIKFKNEALFMNIKWTDNNLTFSIVSAANEDKGLTFFVPATHGNSGISQITLNGEIRQFITRSVKGHEYAFVTLPPFSHSSIVASYR
jgi:hypothetical protein